MSLTGAGFHIFNSLEEKMNLTKNTGLRLHNILFCNPVGNRTHCTLSVELYVEIPVFNEMQWLHRDSQCVARDICLGVKSVCSEGR